MSSSFDQLLDALGQPSPVLPKVDLNFLSDLDGAQVERLRKLWTRLDPIRRREIMGELGRLAQEHIELNFERVDRMALSGPGSEVRRPAPTRRREIRGEWGRRAQEHIKLNCERVDRMAFSDPDSEVRRLAIDNL